MGFQRSMLFVTLATILAIPVLALAAADVPSSKLRVIPSDHKAIFYHGRWDNNTGSWWAGTGFKINIRDLKYLFITLGEFTSWPSAPASVSFNGEPSTTVKLANGVNELLVPIGTGVAEKGKETLVRVNVQGWQSNRIQFKEITVNAAAKLVPYKPAKRVFQFVGDSLSAGQFLPQGVNQAWPYLVGEHYKSEHRINAQPGATLTDMESYGNVHGISFQYFRIEDTGFIWTSDHNYTTPWNFKKDQPKATHIVLHVGANDASHGITNDDFVKVYSEFLVRVRKINPRAPIFVFTPWGWPNADGNTYYYYQGQYERIVKIRHDLGDKAVHLVDTTGWVSWSDVYEENVHPNEVGHANVAKKFISWLDNFEQQ